jgi:homoisocitrate dehydrogenase
VTGPLRLCVIAGDGVGREVLPVAVDVLRRALPGLEIVEAEAGWETFRQTGTALPEETLRAARDCGALLFGAVASPSHPVACTRPVPEAQRRVSAAEGEGYRSPIVALRRELDVYANLRPVRGWPVPGADSSLDLLVVRENTEGLYSERERREGDTAIAERVISRRGSERVAQVAFRLALAEGRKVTVVHKANILRVSDGLWRETCLEVARQFPAVEVEEALVDSAAYHLARVPGRYQLLLCTNLFGDILSDLAAAFGGGLGMAPSLSLGELYAIAEPVHGAAPDIAGRGIANPIGAVLSGALLARYWWDRPDVAGAIEAAVARVLAAGLYTPDIAPPSVRPVGTEAMREALVGAM